MSTILYIQASPRRERSKSIQIADAFVARYLEAKPDTEVQTLNLFDADLPAFDHIAVEGKYALLHGTEANEATAQAFSKVVEVIEEFKAADIYVFAVPMWNFGIPYRLKHYLDLLLQPTHTFAVGKNGYEGLLHGKRAFCAYTRGGDYKDKDGVDFQKRYMDFALPFIGITDIRAVVAQPLLAAGSETAETAMATAIVAARDAADTLAAKDSPGGNA